VGNPSLSSLVDPFTAPTLNASLWNKLPTGWALDTVHQYVTVPVPTASGSVNAFGTNNLYDATGATIYARVGIAQLGAGHVGTRMRIRLDGSNACTMRVDSGSFQMNVITGGTTVTTTLPTYDPVQHAWWRLREASGVFYADTSPDGVSWTNLASMAYTWAATAVTFQFETAALATENSGNLAWFQHVNTPAGGSPLLPSWPQIRFRVGFNSNGTLSVPPSYTDLSSRLRGSWQATLAGRQYELDQVQSGQLTLTLDNRDGALDPTNSSSPYSPNVLPLKPCHLQALWPAGGRNLLPQGLSAGSSTTDAQATAGTPFVATVSGVPTGHTTALGSTFAATTAGGQAFGQGSTNNQWASQSDPDACTVTAGLTYTFSAWVAVAAGGDSGFQVTPRISWYSAAGARISTSDGTPVTAPVVGSWAQVVVSGAAPAGAVNARVELLNTNATTVSNTMYATAWQLEQGSSATPWTLGPVVYPLWTGFVERWPQQWDYAGTRGLVDLTCIDPLAALAQFTLQPSLVASLEAMGPDRLYPLDEPSGATGFRDLTGKHGLGNILHGNLGSGTVTFGSSVQGTGFTGAAGPVVTLANPAPSGNNQACSFLNLAVPNGPPVSSGNGWTRIICFRTTTVPTSPAVMALWWWQNSSASNQSQGGIYIDSSGHIDCTSQNAAGQALSSGVSVNVCDGNWHMFAMILSQDGKTMNFNLDGSGFFVTSTNNVQPSGINCDTIGVAANFNINQYVWAYSGDLAYAVEVPTTNVPSFSDLASGFSTGWAGETSLKRAQRILTMAGYNGSLTVEGTNIAAGGANLAGKDAVSALTEIAEGEAGQLWADGSGAVRIDGRVWRYLQNSAAIVFGENQSSGEVPYLVDASVDFDPTHVYNSVSVTNEVAPGATQQPAATASNSASQTAYLPRTLQTTVNVNDPTIPQYLANYLAQAYGSPYARVPTLTIDGASNPALWPKILGVAFGTRATVNRRPPSWSGAQQLSLPQFVEHVSWAGDDQGNLKLSLQVSPAQPYTGFGVVASLHSTLQAGSGSGTNTITLGALTGSASNPAAAVLAAGTVLTVGYGTSVAENVTVKSVAATSPGYTSVVVTLTANLANTHVTGETVCQPLPNGYVLPSQVASGFPASLDAGATLTSTGPLVSY
jgi:hypothetical protein